MVARINTSAVRETRTDITPATESYWAILPKTAPGGIVRTGPSFWGCVLHQLATSLLLTCPYFGTVLVVSPDRPISTHSDTITVLQCYRVIVLYCVTVILSLPVLRHFQFRQVRVPQASQSRYCPGCRQRTNYRRHCQYYDPRRDRADHRPNPCHRTRHLPASRSASRRGP